MLVTATVFREGHEMLGAGVVLRDPRGAAGPLVLMRELAPGTDRYGAEVAADGVGLWHFQRRGLGRPGREVVAATPGSRCRLGQDAELMLTEGALLLSRAASGIRLPRGAVPARVHAARAARAVLNALRETRLPDAGTTPWTGSRRRRCRGDGRAAPVPAARAGDPVGPATR